MYLELKTNNNKKMSISWIATNPRVNTRSQALAVAMPDSEFAELMRLIVHVCLFILSTIFSWYV